MPIDTPWFFEQMKAKGYTLQRLAPLIPNQRGKPMDHAMLSRMLNGEREMGVKEAARLAELLEVSIDELVRRAIGSSN